MRILIVSDTHKRDQNLKWVLEEKGPFDMLIHLGDSEGSEQIYPEWIGPDCQLHMVLGNNDFFSLLEREEEIMIGGYKTLLTHGHYYRVSIGTKYLEQEARARGFDLVMFGHTHRPFFERYQQEGEKDLILLNPGSLSYPRQDGRQPSYMVMELDETGEANFSQFFL